jgi:hypothetical protein
VYAVRTLCGDTCYCRGADWAAGATDRCWATWGRPVIPVVPNAHNIEPHCFYNACVCVRRVFMCRGVIEEGARMTHIALHRRMRQRDRHRDRAE